MSEQLYPYSHLNFTCDSCDNEFQNQTAYSPTRNLTQLVSNYTYCFNCVEFTEEKPRQKKAKPKTKKDKRITGRTKQLNLKVKEEIYWLLKEMASKEKKLMTEVLEKVLKFYNKK